MKKVRLLLYKSKLGDGHVIDDAIGMWTKIVNVFRPSTWLMRSYSHCEIWTLGTYKKFSRVVDYGTCWTSTMRGNYDGCVKRPASEVLTHPERWDYVEFDVPNAFYDAGIAWMSYVVEHNTGYSKKLIGRFFFPWVKDVDRYICSKFCDYALFHFRILHVLSCPSPLRLGSWFKKQIRSLV